MPLPDSQLQKLQEDLAVHEKRLTAIENSIRAQQAEADTHRILIGLGRDHGLLTAFGEIYDHPEVAQEASKDPVRFLARHGAKLPAGMTISIDSTGATEAKLHGSFPAVARWDRTTGFSVGPLSAGQAS